MTPRPTTTSAPTDRPESPMPSTMQTPPSGSVERAPDPNEPGGDE
jgi:hypothetical protein